MLANADPRRRAADLDSHPSTRQLDRYHLDWHPGARTALIVAGALGVNLVIYAISRGAGARFTYDQSGTATRVDALAITLLSVVPLAVGLTLVAAIARRWPAILTAARIIAPALAVFTIGLMTIPAHFDSASTLSLAAMHLVLVPAALVALRGLAASRGS